MANRVMFDGAGQLVVQRGSHSSYVTPHLAQRRPIGWLIAGQSATYGIDAKSKQTVECRMRLLTLALILNLNAEEVLGEKVPVECLEVSHIEDDAMTLRDRPLIKGLGTNQAEKLIASAAGFEDPFQKPPMNR